MVLGGRVWYKNSFDVLDGERNVVRHHAGGQNHELVTKGIPEHPVKGLLVVNDWDKARRFSRTGRGRMKIGGSCLS